MFLYPEGYEGMVNVATVAVEIENPHAQDRDGGNGFYRDLRVAARLRLPDGVELAGSAEIRLTPSRS
jgi:hypothetical protein